MRNKRVKLKFLLSELDKMFKKYYYDGILKEVFINNPRYKYEVISKNKQSRSLLRKMKSYMLPCNYIEPVYPESAVCPESNEIKVRFSTLPFNPISNYKEVFNNEKKEEN